MKIEFWESSEGDWIDIFVNEKKVLGEHEVQIRQLMEILKPYLPEDTNATYHIWKYGEDKPKRYGYYLGE